jgi:hypothetical protein
VGADLSASELKPLPLLEIDGSTRNYDQRFAQLWLSALDWIEQFYDSHHLRATVTWMLALDPGAPDPLLFAALTHDMERAYPGGTQPDKANGLWDDVEYNTRHMRRSATIVSDWLRSQGASEKFVAQVAAPILEHEFGGSAQGDLIQAADSLSFLEVDADLAARWVLNGETTVEHARRKLEWMYERIRLERARPLARPVYEEALQTLERDLQRPQPT